ncbi:MAG: asparagine synthase-related protein, partial [Burkholderiaceae bacterium]
MNASTKKFLSLFVFALFCKVGFPESLQCSTSIIKNIADKNEQVNSFSVVFDEKKYNEQKWSREVAKKYDTNHFEINASKKIGILQVNEALKSLDEPYSDPSVVPSYIVSNEVSKYYKVAISGDGGDELLGGYE